MSVSERGYLSIGEVLALLQEEFPDVTISKIRFLESQGLIEPERTHSGYRKFYGPDVDRLRFILREQREHYLPLRVIRDRLDAGPGEGDLDGEPIDDHSIDADAPVTPLAFALPLALAAVPAALDGDEPTTTTPDEVDSHAMTDGDPPDPVPAASEPEAHVPVWMRKAPPGVQPRQLGSTPSSLATAPTHDEDGDRPAVAPRTFAPSAETTTPAGELTLEELAEAAGVTTAAIRELERFGLLTARVSGRTPYYDGGAVVAARLAAGFQRHGIEARHLRLYKQFVEREAALFEQVILPLTKQRNPRARAQASEALHDLAQLGAAMRDLFVDRALRDLEP
jgi:DNA-binding transcriptional MerR regulator